MKEIDLLKNQIKDNSIKWYPFEEKIEYKILNNFSKSKEIELKDACANLESNGRIILLLENKLSIKNVCQKCNNIEELYNRKELEDLLDKYKLKYRKFYYIFPDLETANVIFTDKKLPDIDSVSRDIFIHDTEQIIKNNEKDLIENLVKQDSILFKTFSNSFLVECSKEEFEDNNIEFVSFSNMRKQEYRIQTIIRGDFVYKEAFSNRSTDHINNIKRNIDLLNKLKINSIDRYEENKIISEYQRHSKTLNLVIKEKIQSGNPKDAIRIIEKFFNYLKEKLLVTDMEKNVFDKFKIKYMKKEISNLTFVEYGFWDMIFQNTFYIKDNFYFYDQEWMEHKIPLEFIIYRAFSYNEDIKLLLNKEDIYNKFNITEENIRLFKELDKKMQDNIKNEIFWKYHINAVTIEKIKNEKEEMYSESIKLLNEKDARIKFLEENMEETVKLLREKEKEITNIKNSTSWKITEPLRNIKNRKRKNNENKR